LLWSGLVRLTIGAGDDDCVSVGVADPDLAMSRAVALAFGRIAVRRPYYRCAELGGPRHDAIEVGDVTEAQQDAVAHFGVGLADATVVVLDVAVMKLQSQNPIGEQPFVVGPPWSLRRPSNCWYQRLDASTSRTVTASNDAGSTMGGPLTLMAGTVGDTRAMLPGRARRR
jgi:hypothetical protein